MPLMVAQAVITVVLLALLVGLVLFFCFRPVYDRLHRRALRWQAHDAAVEQELEEQKRFLEEARAEVSREFRQPSEEIQVLLNKEKHL
jgi:uncharacterized membrane-anchored protein YhcB (DUF1043 family)